MKITRLNELIENGKRSKGFWRLSKNGELVYSRTGNAEEARIKAPLIAVEPEALVAAVSSRQSDQNVTTTLIRLSGSWRADARNRLVFDVERETGKKDSLTFEGTWELDEKQQIVLRLDRTRLKTRTRLDRSFTFRGHWDLSKRHRLVYSLSRDSGFEFRGAFQTSSILAKKGEVRYQLGAGARSSGRTRTVTLFGKWKFSDRTGVSFEVASGGRTCSILFGAEYRLNRVTGISASLKFRDGSRTGIDLLLTRDLFPRDGSAFVRLQKDLQETRIEAGTGFFW